MNNLLPLKLLSAASILLLLVLVLWTPPALNSIPQLEANLLMAGVVLLAVGSTTALGVKSYKQASPKNRSNMR